MKRPLMLLMVAAAVTAFGTGIPAAATAQAGRATVVDDSGKPLRSGGSATDFMLALPLGAACPGDTYSDGYVVYSYVTRVPTDPASLTFPATYPSSGVDLISTGGVPYITQPTARFTGAVQALPVFSWSRYDHDAADLPPGEYNVGVACAKGEGKVARFWNTQISFVTSSADTGGFTWQVLGSDSSSSRHGSGVGADIGYAVGGLVIVLFAAFAAGVITRRRLGRAVA